MVAPVLGREGARVGGVLTDRAAFTCRTDSNGATLSVEVATDPGFNNLVGSVTTGTLASGNNYQATAYVTGLRAGRRYYWRIKATDATTNSTLGKEPLHGGSFRTLPADASKRWRIGLIGCNNGFQMGANADRAKHSSIVYRNIAAMDLHALIHLGDVMYPDIASNRGTVPLGANAWYAQQTATDDSSLDRWRTNWTTTLDGSIQGGGFYSLGHLMAATPGWFMWDDHDRAYDDCGALPTTVTTWQVNKRDHGHQVSHEYMMDLNAHFVDQESDRDFATDALGDSTTPAEYYYVDVPPARFIVLDCRSHRSLKTDTDNASKTMLGATQKAWLKARILDNPQPFLVLCTPLMLDGDHGWFESSNDGWKGYTTERDEILDYIRANGNAARTVILSSDTHVGSVAKYRGFGKTRHPIYEVMSANNWFPTAHGYITGMAENLFRSGESAGASGEGGRLEHMYVGGNCMTLVEGGPYCLRVALVSTHEGVDTAKDQRNKVLWSRTFR